MYWTSGSVKYCVIAASNSVSDSALKSGAFLLSQPVRGNVNFNFTATATNASGHTTTGSLSLTVGGTADAF
jgi:hypothetical protein